MSRLDNLKPFQPGNQAAVGHGRPRGRSFKKIFDDLLEIEEEAVDLEGNKLMLTQREIIAIKWMRQARIEEGVTVGEKILHITEGKPIERIEQTGKDGGPIESVSNVIGLPEVTERIQQMLAPRNHSDNEVSVQD